MQHNNRVKEAKINREELGITEVKNVTNMQYRFIREREVTQKNQIFLVFKSSFLAKIKQLESNGHCIEAQKAIIKWIDENWEDMYDQMIRKSKN